MEENAIFTFDSPKGQSSYIKVIGVGGGGGNAVNHMYREGINGVDFIVCNTDMKALNASPVPNKIILGDLGLGAGNKPECARKAAEAKKDDIREALAHNTQMLFITAGMGGGTGTGAAPVIAEIAKSIDLDNDETKKILVVAIVTLPFSFENKRRHEQARQGIEELRRHVDSILVINNDKLRTFKDFGLSKAFGMANDILLTAAKGIAEIITVDAYVNIDFQDVNTVMENSGTALMGAGSGTGETRAMDAIKAASTSVLLNDNDISGAKNVLLYFSYHPDHEITMDELGEITDFISEKTNGTADVIWGAGSDEKLGDELKVTLIATGFEKSNLDQQTPNTFVLHNDIEDTKPQEKQTPVAVSPDEPVIVHREPGEDLVKEEPVNKTEKPSVDIFAPIVTKEEVKVDMVIPETPVVTVEPPVAIEPPAVEPSKKNIFVLDEEVEEEEESVPALVDTNEQQDHLVSDIHVVDEEVVPEKKAETMAYEPVAEPVRSPKEPTISAFRNDNDVQTAADRIRLIHDLLRNNPNGAELVQRMPAHQMADGDLYEGSHSSARESAPFTIHADGSMTRNAYFGDQPD